MATSAMSHGEIVQIAEVLSDARLQQRSVRVTGRLEKYDAMRSQAVISFQGAQMTVDTSILAMDAGRELRIGSMYQFLGETSRVQSEVQLKARVMRNVDNLDIDLFIQALELRRQFLSSH